MAAIHLATPVWPGIDRTYATDSTPILPSARAFLKLDHVSASPRGSSSSRKFPSCSRIPCKPLSARNESFSNESGGEFFSFNSEKKGKTRGRKRLNAEEYAEMESWINGLKDC